MVYYLNLSRRENEKTKQYQAQHYFPINAPAQDGQYESSSDLHRKMWTAFFRNPKLTSIIFIYHRWNNHIRDYVIYAVTHGIRVGVTDMALNQTLQFEPISNLARSKFASDILLSMAYDHVWNSRSSNQDRFKKKRDIEPKQYLLKQLKADNLRYFNDQEDTLQFQQQLEHTAHVIDKLDMEQVNSQLPYFGFVYEFTERLRQLIDIFPEQMREVLPYMPRYDEPYQFLFDVMHIPFFEKLSKEVWDSLKDFKPLQSRETLIDFAHTWAGRYEIPIPNNDKDAMAVGFQILYYIAESIPPCRDCRLEDMISYERVAYEIETEEEDSAIM